MLIQKLVVKNFGGVRSITLNPDKSNNFVEYEVGYAIALLLNNQFAMRYLKEIPVRKETELYMELDGEEGDIYTIRLEGGDILYLKNGRRLGVEEIEKDSNITRPYREDNLTLFMENKSEDFFDYVKFMPTYIKKLIPYSSTFEGYLYNHRIPFISSSKYFIDYNFTKKRFVPVKWKSYYAKQSVREGTYDELLFRYSCFLGLNVYISHFNGQRGKRVYTPLLVQGVADKLAQDVRQRAMENTKETKRQAFFFNEYKN